MSTEIEKIAEQFKDGLKKEDILSILGENQLIYHFENNYGASIICHCGSLGAEKGLCELAVIKFTKDKDGFSLTYDTPIANDVIGYLNVKEAIKLLKHIKKL